MRLREGYDLACHADARLGSGGVAQRVCVTVDRPPPAYSVRTLSRRAVLILPPRGGGQRIVRERTLQRPARGEYDSELTAEEGKTGTVKAV